MQPGGSQWLQTPARVTTGIQQPQANVTASHVHRTIVFPEGSMMIHPDLVTSEALSRPLLILLLYREEFHDIYSRQQGLRFDFGFLSWWDKHCQALETAAVGFVLNQALCQGTFCFCPCCCPPPSEGRSPQLYGFSWAPVPAWLVGDEHPWQRKDASELIKKPLGA